MEPVVHVLAPVSVAAFLFVLVRFAFCKWLRLAKHSLAVRLPPGPQAIPVLGNVHQLPSDYQEKTFAEWTKQYGASALPIRRRRRFELTSTIPGDVVYARIFRRPVLVLGSLRAAQDLLERKSGNFSDRPRLILLSEL